MRLDDGAFLLDGVMSIIEINDRLDDDGILLPEGEYQTIAGLVLRHTGAIPREQDAVQVAGLSVTVTEMTGARINRVRLERLPAAPPASPDQSGAGG